MGITLNGFEVDEKTLLQLIQAARSCTIKVEHSTTYFVYSMPSVQSNYAKSGLEIRMKTSTLMAYVAWEDITSVKLNFTGATLNVAINVR